MSFQVEWERKKEERQRKRMEKEGGLLNGSSSYSPTKSGHMTVPGVQLKQTPKSPKAMQGPVNGEKELNEAEKKAEELRQKREQERIEAEQGAREEIQKTTISTMTPERKEEIRRSREERERLERQEEEERKAKIEEDGRKMREEIQRRRQEAEAKRKLAEEEKAAYSIPKYDIADSIARAKREKTQTSAEMLAERERRVAENVPDIRISARDSPERLREIAEMLHSKLVEVYGDIYDLNQRKERQDYDLKEINARIKDLSKNKTRTVTTIESGHVSMLKEKALSSDDKKLAVDVKVSVPSTGNIADRLQQLQSNLKKDTSPDKGVKKDPIKRNYSTPEQIKEELEASKKEIERFRIQREENRKKREEDMKKIEEQEAERRRKQDEERQKQAEERERLKKEKEEKEKARRAMIGGPGTSPAAPVSIKRVVSQRKVKNREETISERVPAMAMIMDATSDEELRNIANDIYNRLKTTLGDIFDMEETKKKNEYYINELSERVGNLKATKSGTLVNSGIVSKMTDGGSWATKKQQNGVAKSPKPKEFGTGGIAAEGGVRGRLAMFSGGQDIDTPKTPTRSPGKVNIYK